MNLLLSFALSASLVAPGRSIGMAEPDSGSVAFTTATVWLRASPTFNPTTKRVVLLPRGAEVRVIGCQEQNCNVEFRQLQGFVPRELLRTTPTSNPVDAGRGSVLSPEEKLAILLTEHRVSLPIFIIPQDSDYPALEPMPLP